MSRRARLTFDELHELKWLLGSVLALLALWALSLLDFSGALILVFGVSMIAASLIAPIWVSGVAERFSKWIAPLILLFVVADFALNLPNFLPPLARMVTLLLLYRSLTPRRRREDLQLLLLCLFCLVISGALTISLLFALQILLFAPLGMALLFVICLLDRGKESREHSIDWQHVRWSRLLKRVWDVLDVRLIILGGLMFSGLVVVSSLMFVLLPRFELDQAIPFLQIEGRSKVGFSGEVQLGAVTDIRQDNAEAFRVDVPSLDAVTSSPYWRMMVLDAYSDGHFRMSPVVAGKEYRRIQQVPAVEGWGAWGDKAESGNWTFYFEGGVSEYLPVPGAFRRMRFQTPQDMEWLPTLQLYSTDKVKQSVFFYQLENMSWRDRFPAAPVEVEAFEATAGPLLTAKQVYPQTLLTLSLSEDERTVLKKINEVAMAQVVQPNAVSYSKALTDYLRLGFNYSMKSSLPESEYDPVVNWLENGTVGHCEYFASAFILLAREAGYPARMVVGFAGGSWNSVEEYLVVRNNSAHAWAEIYDARTQEWLRIDPTPGAVGAAVAGEEAESVRRTVLPVESGMAAWIDSLRIQWYRRIVDFDQEDQVRMATSIKEVGQEFFQALSERAKFWLSVLKETITEPFSTGSILRVGVIVTLVVGLYVLWWSRYGWLSLWHQLRRKPKILSPVRQQAGRYLEKIKQRSEHGDLSEALIIARGRLEAIRFGPDVAQSVAKSAFCDVKRALR